MRFIHRLITPSDKMYVWVKRSPLGAIWIYLYELVGDAWFWMIALGIIHSYALAVPALGFFIVLLLRFLIGNSSLLQVSPTNALTHRRKYIKR